MGLTKDSGTTVIHPNQGAEKIVDGQQQTQVFGNDVFTSKKGTLDISFRGTDITVNNFDPTRAATSSIVAVSRLLQEAEHRSSGDTLVPARVLLRDPR